MIPAASDPSVCSCANTCAHMCVLENLLQQVCPLWVCVDPIGWLGAKWTEPFTDSQLKSQS